MGCSSVVVFYPFASRFQPLVISAVSVGGGKQHDAHSHLRTRTNVHAYTMHMRSCARMVPAACALKPGLHP